MAFLRVEKKKSGSYLRIVESYRDDSGQTRHRTLFNLGKSDQYSPDSLQRIGQRLFELGGGALRDLVGNQVSELGRFNYGFPLVYGRIFKRLGLDRVMGRISRRRKLTTDFEASVMLMLVERLNDPLSKRANHLNQDEYLGLNKVDLQHLYRSLDYLAADSRAIQSAIFHRGRDLFNHKLDMVFYDVTTFYFDSSVEQEGALRQKGFSKDGKIGKTQVVFGMLVDKEKRPIAYRLYKGDTWEGHTFGDAVEQLRREYMIDKLIVVADRGMMTKANVGLLDAPAVDYQFIMGERMRNIDKDALAHLLDLGNYTLELATDERGDPEAAVRCCMIEVGEKTLVGSYSVKRAKKDRYERERKVEKGRRMLGRPAEIRKKAGAYYLTQTGKDKYELDQEKIDRAAKYDGFLVVATNTGLDAAEVLGRYHELFKIEHCFRTFKSYLETRPMFHWTDSRIEGHICLCYMAYAMLNRLQLELGKAGHEMSENLIRKTLSKMQLSLIRQGSEEYYLRSATGEETGNILKTMKIKPLPDMMHKSQIDRHL